MVEASVGKELMNVCKIIKSKQTHTIISLDETKCQREGRKRK